MTDSAIIHPASINSKQDKQTLPEHLPLDHKYILKTLPNGIRVLFIPLKYAETLTYEIHILNGMDHEIRQNLLQHTHFLEHLNAQFTSKTFPDSKSIKRTLETYGIETNASTSSTHTKYWMTGLATPDHQKIMFHLMFRSYIEFQVDDVIFDQERKAVIQELKQVQNVQWVTLSEREHSLLYKNHPREFTIQNSIDNAEKTKLHQILKYRESHVLPENTLIIVAGQFSVKKTFAKISNLFNAPKLGINPAENNAANLVFPPAPAPFIGPIITFVENKQVQSTKLSMTYKITFHPETTEQYTMDTIIWIMSSGMNSRLYVVLREKLGVIYGVKMEGMYDNNDGLSVLNISLTADSANIGLIVRTILEQIDVLIEHGITDDEMSKIRNMILLKIAKDRLNMNSAKYVDLYAKNILWNKPIKTYKERSEQYMAITKEDIKDIAKKAFRLSRLLVAVSGKDGDLSDVIKKEIPNAKII
jgi:zinc protease